MKKSELRQIIREETIKIFESDNSKIKQFSKIKITKPLTHGPANNKHPLEPGEYKVNQIFRARNGFIMRLIIQNKKAQYTLDKNDLKGNMGSIELISENEQLDEISLKQGALAALLALASFTGKAQDKVGPNIDNSKIASAVTNFQSAYRKTGDEKFNVGEDDVKTMTGKQFEELMLAAFAERGIMAKGSPELQQRIDSLQKAHGPEAQFKEVFKINYLAPVENKSAFELAFAKAYKEGMDTFTYEGKEYKVEINKAGTSKSGKVEIKILPAGKRTQVNPQNESKLRNIVREVLKGK